MRFSPSSCDELKKVCRQTLNRERISLSWFPGVLSIDEWGTMRWSCLASKQNDLNFSDGLYDADSIELEKDGMVKLRREGRWQVKVNRDEWIRQWDSEEAYEKHVLQRHKDGFDEFNRYLGNVLDEIILPNMCDERDLSAPRFYPSFTVAL